jgi:hypothetical protein
MGVGSAAHVAVADGGDAGEFFEDLVRGQPAFEPIHKFM